MLKQTPLHALHESKNAHLVDFAGWSMPLHYGSQISEHLSVRQNIGMFDVSHMGILDVQGSAATTLLRQALANDIAKLKDRGTALYSCMLNSEGGVIDDLIVYRFAEYHYRLVVNASRCHIDWKWLAELANDHALDAVITQRNDLALIAVQGPNTVTTLSEIFLQPPDSTFFTRLKPFRFASIGDEWLIARTGYTGEDGVELMLPANELPDFWSYLLDEGIPPCGLGARDTLRLEAGLNLYGHDMDESTTPYESNLGWTVCWKDPQRQFIGRDALAQQIQQGIPRCLVGLVMQDKVGVLRTNQIVQINTKDETLEGIITSGTFSPTLDLGIGFARVPMSSQTIINATVTARSQQLSVNVVKPPFVRFGKPAFNVISSPDLIVKPKGVES